MPKLQAMWENCTELYSVADRNRLLIASSADAEVEWFVSGGMVQPEYIDKADHLNMQSLYTGICSYTNKVHRLLYEVGSAVFSEDSEASVATTSSHSPFSPACTFSWDIFLWEVHIEVERIGREFGHDNDKYRRQESIVN